MVLTTLLCATVSAPAAWADPTPEAGPPTDVPRPAVPGAPAEPEVADPGAVAAAPEVAPLEETRSAQYFAVDDEAIAPDRVEEIAELEHVEHVEQVDAARVTIDGEVTSVLGVDPDTFRAYAPAPSAESDEVWAGVADGHLALSHELGQERDLDVGSTVTVSGAAGDVEHEVWTHATSGVAGIDALAARDVTGDLGFPEGNAVLVSAPEADLWELRDDLEELLGVPGADADATEDDGRQPNPSLQLLVDHPEEAPPGTGEAVAGDTLEAMIAAAESQLGVPYVWGGDSPGGGFDCSGLVQWAFTQAGVQVPRVAADQWAAAGQQIPFAEAERGDLLFWRSDPTAPGHISHVAIYLGGDTMLEAPRSGDVVKYSDVRTANMAGAVRVAH
ncbi:C40 family peptidase [Lipingzhangella sp. LS1_29]|uniref:C40 family peptidase n=1 Tax=Lipingzhangella rawalii TaxID=2055835 RepID=A0ABU2H6P0_9ACTN|nr:C40 family peptidase [Lipingzhangella rawalii]